ncbi:MAG: amino acid permease, partial [Bacteroidales bacterium]
FEPLFNYARNSYGWDLPRQVISIPAMLGLSLLILRKGANMGVKTLYIVVGILFLSLLMFFLGRTPYAEEADFSLTAASFTNREQFFFVFAIIFPAFTGMTAGVGLSGELKKPSRSIPLGTVIATISGMIVYIFIAWKFKSVASVDNLINNQFVMADVAIWGKFIIPLGLAASTLSSAIGSIMVAPRTLQALAKDRSLPSRGVNRIFSKVKSDTGEPFNATFLTSIIALIFVAAGNVNAVAEIISMFFMVTYGSLCLISFLNHFGSSPSYRPSFRSKWYISLIGFLTAIWLMFKINFFYAFLAVILMILIYMITNYYHKDRKGLEAIFTNSLFQINRNLQVYLQKTSKSKHNKEWRPSAICINRDSFTRENLFRVLNWISYKYGFGTYIHLIHGYYSRENSEQAAKDLEKLIIKYEKYKNQVYIDTLLSPSYTSAIAQTIQLPGISGMENNMIMFEFDKERPKELDEILDNLALVKAGKFDICILGSSTIPFDFNEDIHVWIRSTDQENAHLLVLLSFIILGHKDWRKSNIKIFDLCKQGKEAETRKQLEELIINGRLPITTKNIQIISEDPGKGYKKLIVEKSQDAGLTLVGFREDAVKHKGKAVFMGFEEMGNILFVNSHSQKEI